MTLLSDLSRFAGDGDVAAILAVIALAVFLVWTLTTPNPRR
jgi:hypothetical protein